VPKKDKKPRSAKPVAQLAAAQAGNVGRHRSPETRAKIGEANRGPNHPMFGKHHSDEARAKNRAAHLEVPLSPERCAAMSGPNSPRFGKHHSEETKAKQREAAMSNKYAEGCVHSPEAQAKHRAASLGPKNPQWGKKGPESPTWLGGISRHPYAWTFNKELKEEVRRRDGYKCQLCGVPQAECKTSLPVHHIDYDKKNSDPVNLVALCKSCHSKTNKNRKHWATFFQSLALERELAGGHSLRHDRPAGNRANVLPVHPQHKYEGDATARLIEHAKDSGIT